MALSSVVVHIEVVITLGGQAVVDGGLCMAMSSARPFSALCKGAKYTQINAGRPLVLV